MKTPRPIDLQLGAALYFWRTFDRLTQREIAGRLGMWRIHYARWENSRTSPLNVHTFVRLAEGLNVSPYILTLTMEALA